MKRLGLLFCMLSSCHLVYGSDTFVKDQIRGSGQGDEVQQTYQGIYELLAAREVVQITSPSDSKRLRRLRGRAILGAVESSFAQPKPGKLRKLQRSISRRFKGDSSSSMDDLQTPEPGFDTALRIPAGETGPALSLLAGMGLATSTRERLASQATLYGGVDTRSSQSSPKLLKRVFSAKAFRGSGLSRMGSSARVAAILRTPPKVKGAKARFFGRSPIAAVSPHAVGDSAPALIRPRSSTFGDRVLYMVNPVDKENELVYQRFVISRFAGESVGNGMLELYAASHMLTPEYVFPINKVIFRTDLDPKHKTVRGIGKFSSQFMLSLKIHNINIDELTPRAAYGPNFILSNGYRSAIFRPVTPTLGEDGEGHMFLSQGSLMPQVFTDKRATHLIKLIFDWSDQFLPGKISLFMEYLEAKFFQNLKHPMLIIKVKSDAVGYLKGLKSLLFRFLPYIAILDLSDVKNPAALDRLMSAVTKKLRSRDDVTGEKCWDEYKTVIITPAV